MVGIVHEPGSDMERRRVVDPQKKREKSTLILWICIALEIFFLLNCMLPTKDSGGIGLSRNLLKASDGTSQSSWREEGLDVLYFIGIPYTCFGIYFVCDHFFTNSLKAISKRLNLSEDIAGATIKAVGSSMPELLASFVALANNRVSNEVEVGIIVGSAVFKILVTNGLSAMFSDHKLTLDYRPLLRDCLFYTIAIVGLMVVCHDGKIYWWEGLIYVSLYGVYIFALKFNKVVLNLFSSSRSMFENFIANDVDLETLPYEHLETSASDEEIYYETKINGNMAPLLPATNDEASNMVETNYEQGDQTGSTQTSNQVDNAQETEDDRYLFTIPESKRERLYWLLSLPWSIPFYYTVLDCSKERHRKYYMLTFALSILWMGAISWFMIEWADDLDSLLGIPADVMGETFLTVGISVPSVLAAISVATDGKADLAVTNCVGSNVFDIWIGLGLPWLFVIPFVGEKSSYGRYIEVDNTRLFSSVALSFVILLFYLLSVVCSGWRLNKRHGQLFIVLYGVFALYHIVAVWVFDIYHREEVA